MIDALLVPLSIPSPDQGVWQLGPIPIRAYALAIVTGIFAAIWLGERRWVARGGVKGQISDLALWAVPSGLIGARAYHVATDWRLYFPENPIGALEIWNGGLGIWGAIAGGFLGASIGARRMGMRILPLADALAPGLLLAQAIGRFGNYFNQELFGAPTDRPWGLEIDPAFRPDGYEQFATFHPTFLYESLWNLGALALLLWADRRFRLGHGRVFALYVMTYTLGRAWIENLRIDDVQLQNVLGLRLNVWTSIILFALAAAAFVWQGRRRPGREERVLTREPAPADGSAATADGKDGKDAEDSGDPDASASAGSSSGSGSDGGGGGD